MQDMQEVKIYGTLAYDHNIKPQWIYTIDRNDLIDKHLPMLMGIIS